jgi:ABC-type lipoprotein release transport system permease subunit
MKDLQRILLSKILFSSQRKKLKSSYILITLVVILLVLSQVFVDSMTLGITKRYALLGSGHIQTSVLNDISSYDFIEEANDVLTGSALAYGEDSVSQIVVLKGVDNAYFNNQRASVISISRTEIESTLSNIFISQTLSNQLNIKIGEKMAIVADNGNKRLYPKLCFVKGIYDSGYKELDQYMIFCDQSLLKKVYKENVIQNKEIILKDGININQAMGILSEDGINSIPWYAIEGDLYRNLITSTQTLMTVFLVIALLSGFFISSVASDLIGSSHKSIAINKLLGLSSKKIRWTYFLAIEIVTLLSIISGIIFGILLSYVLPVFLQFLSLQSIPSLSWYLLKFDIIIPYQKLLFITLSLLFVSVLSVYLSLRRANKIEPMYLMNQD